MQATEASAFRELVSDTLAMYGKEITVGTQRLWWAALAAHDFVIVRRAFSAHITGKRGQFAPLPADILNHIRGESGHLTADEAWPLVLESMDESRTVVWTPEIAEASAPARTCLGDGGDKYGARKAFEAAYERILRTAPPVPKWTVSLGDDKSHRIIALQAGHEAGRLTDAQVLHLMPPKKAEGNVVALLTGKTVDASIDPRWTELSRQLSESAANAIAEREAQRLEKSKAFNESRQQALNALGAANGH